MSKTCVRSFVVSLAVVFLASVVLAQEPEKKTPVSATSRVDCDPNTCTSKVLDLPNFPTAVELQDLVNTFRIIADFTNIQAKPSDHAIALKGTTEQFAIAEKLLSVLEGFQSSGSHDRSSVLVYQLKGRLSGTADSERMLAQHPRLASTMCDLSTCYIKAMYLPDLSMPQLQDLINNVRKTTDMPHTITMPSRHVLVLRGTSEQVSVAEMLSMNTRAPQ